MLLTHRHTGKFYTYEYSQVLDVYANHISQPIMDKEESLESFITRNFQLRRGDKFQLRRTSEYREKTYRSVCGDNSILTESFLIKASSTKIIKTLTWTGKKFVEIGELSND